MSRTPNIWHEHRQDISSFRGQNQRLLAALVFLARLEQSQSGLFLVW
jgi:hypothetical protein